MVVNKAGRLVINILTGKQEEKELSPLFWCEKQPLMLFLRQYRTDSTRTIKSAYSLLPVDVQ